MREICLLMFLLLGFSSCHAQEKNSASIDYKDLEYSCGEGSSFTVKGSGDDYVAKYKDEYPQIKDFAIVFVLTKEKNERFEKQIVRFSKFMSEEYFYFDVLGDVSGHYKDFCHLSEADTLKVLGGEEFKVIILDRNKNLLTERNTPLSEAEIEQYFAIMDQ
jgi:hypothetical protein